MIQMLHPLLKVDITLAQLTGAKLFTKLVTNSGFWQVLLSKDPRFLIMFITSYQRFYINKFPFGIINAPEHLQWHMNEIL